VGAAFAFLTFWLLCSAPTRGFVSAEPLLVGIAGAGVADARDLPLR